MTEQDRLDGSEDARRARPSSTSPSGASPSGAGRPRRRSNALAVLAGAVVAGVVLVGMAVLSSDEAPERAGRAVSPLDATGPEGPVTGAPLGSAVGEGQRLVGLGHAAIVVPEEWGTNATRCGTPMHDTVVVDVGAVLACAVPRPRGVESVELWPGRRSDFRADESFAVDGVRALRQRTTCYQGFTTADENVGARVCEGAVYLPSLGVSFHAESSTRRAEVDRILSRVRVVSDRVGVPGFRTFALEEQARGTHRYAAMLRRLGLVAEVRTRKVPAVRAGHVLDVEPVPGTMLRPGDVVTVTVTAPPDGPADEVSVGVTTSDAQGTDYRSLQDRQIRKGAAIELEVGDRIWCYAKGRRSGTLAGSLHGDSLEVDGWREGPNYPHSWVAVAPGRTRIGLTIVAAGHEVELGTVTVVVR